MEKNENVEIRRIIDIVKSKKIVIALIVMIFMLLGYWYSYHYVVPKYKSATTLLLIPNTVSENKTVTNLELVMNAELINTYSNIATNSKVLKQTIQNLGLDISEAKLLRQIRVNIVDNTYIIEIVVSHTDAQKSMEIANELAKVFLQEIQQIYNLNNLGIVDEAQLARGPYNMNHSKDMIVFLGIGIMVSFTYIMLLYIFDNTIKKEEDIENYIKVKSLGNIPIHNDKTQEIVDSNYAKSYMTECMNTIRTNILYMNSAKNAKTILITSCTPQEGKSWVSANIAASFAKVNKKVLLIDADMRKGRAHKIFKVHNVKGLSNYLNAITGNVKKDIKLGKKYIQETKIPNLHILTNGTVPPNPSELLGSKNMKELVAILKNAYDIIIVDAPPCKLVTDSIVLSTMIDSTVLVVNAEKTKINDLKEIRKSIEVVGGEVIGAILNKKKVHQKTYYKNDYYALTKQKDSKKVEETPSITVDEVIAQAMLKLRKKHFNRIPAEKKLVVQEEEQNILEQKEMQKQQDIQKLIKKQNEYLTKMVSDNMNYTQELNKILNHLEEVRQSHLTSSQMKEIVKEEIANLKNTEPEKLTEEHQIQSLIHEKTIQMQEEIQKLLEEEMMKIDYTEQIAQINEMLTNLKDSYLELSNQVKKKDSLVEDFTDVDNGDNRNIIDFKAFKRQKNKKKVYPIDEDIFYHELEKTATCIIPIQTTKMSSSSVKKYFAY